ncbi:hypothetical protein BTVI_120553 [Pitangus sulphuratus]|nr:hypothetical protein BTVI_120553 [Pitangus sulphuratus]
MCFSCRCTALMDTRHCRFDSVLLVLRYRVWCPATGKITPCAWNSAVVSCSSGQILALWADSVSAALWELCWGLGEMRDLASVLGSPAKAGSAVRLVPPVEDIPCEQVFVEQDLWKQVHQMGVGTGFRFVPRESEAEVLLRTKTLGSAIIE